MAKVFVSLLSSLSEQKIPAYYEGFIQSLENAGNEVYLSLTNNMLDRPWDREAKCAFGFKKEKFLADIKAINPDIAFVFNNSCIDILHTVIDCPIIVMEADLALYYTNKEVLRKNPERFHYFSSSDENINMIPKLFGVDTKYIHKLGLATAIQAESIQQDKDISFIGSTFSISNELKKKLQNISTADTNKLLSSQLDFSNNDAKIKFIGAKNPHDEVLSYKDYLNIQSFQKRHYVLQSISNLNLSLYGVGWHDLDKVSLEVARCYDSREIYSVKHNQDIYNSSKLCININHAQVTDAFPWRVVDIMASNGCLISEDNAALQEFLKGYIQIPTYHNIHDARALCQKILHDNQLRNDIVTASQAAVNDKARWSHNFQIIEDIFQISLSEKAATEKNNLHRINSFKYYSDKRYFYRLAKFTANLVPKKYHSFFYNVLKRFNIYITYDFAKEINNKK